MLCSVLCGTCPLGLCMPSFYTFQTIHQGKDMKKWKAHFILPLPPASY